MNKMKIETRRENLTIFQCTIPLLNLVTQETHEESVIRTGMSTIEAFVFLTRESEHGQSTVGWQLLT